ncbi:DUF4367 domain-containing protein [Paenibacillus lautus]|uniref:DUF4367 domain-containing protein n=1 Tax=Paenibacillus lautus TaxID=1401 RepID=UPI003D2BF58D
MKKFLICILLAFTVHPVVHAEPIHDKKPEVGYGYDAPLRIKKPIHPEVPKNWRLETKKIENSILLAYFNSDDNDLIMTIFEENRRSMVPVAESEQTVINNTTYSFYPWKSKQRGWVLRWVKGDVYFEMSSFILNVDEMITITETITKQVKE